MTPERAKEILKTKSIFSDLKMTPLEEEKVRKIWLEHPNGEMSIYSTLLMIAYGYNRALHHIHCENSDW